MKQHDEFPWLKSKGYIHLTPQIDVNRLRNSLISKITNKDYVAKYAFFPLIHSCLKERKFKKIPGKSGDRAHKFIDNSGNIKRTAKPRPLHYATHMDALIFGYYAKILNDKYEKRLKSQPLLSAAVTAYRKIKINPKDINSKGKSTPHFAKDVFDAIKKFPGGECMVLKYDIKSFFNRMDHRILFNAWIDIIDGPESKLKKLPKDHYNVFKACSKFSYILKNDFRVIPFKGSGKKAGFDERNLAKIRNKEGIRSFFSSVEDFRNQIELGKFKIYKFPFRSSITNYPCGIPQGLPISSVLANIYLMKFDNEMIENIVIKNEGFYRRYSDDIIIVCKSEQAKKMGELVSTKILESNVEISMEKEERFLFRKVNKKNHGEVLISEKIEENNIVKQGVPLTYLGFEFYGYKTLVKSANLAKFYRRMILTVKKKARRAFASSEKNPTLTPAIFNNQLFRIYSNRNLSLTEIKTTSSFIIPNERGEFSIETKKISKKYRSNYLKYIERVSDIMQETRITRQIRNYKRILYNSLQKHFYSKL